LALTLPRKPGALPCLTACIIGAVQPDGMREPLLANRTHPRIWWLDRFVRRSPQSRQTRGSSR
jgi:hypothetical protein